MHFWHTSEMKNVFERNFSPVKFGHVSMRPIFELMTCCAIVQWVDILSERNVILLKFMFSKKATKSDKIFTVNLTVCSKCQINSEDFINFCGLLRKH